MLTAVFTVGINASDAVTADGMANVALTALDAFQSIILAIYASWGAWFAFGLIACHSISLVALPTQILAKLALVHYSQTQNNALNAPDEDFKKLLFS